MLSETVSTLHAFNIPLVLASPRLAEMMAPEDNTLTTAPDMASIVQVCRLRLKILAQNCENKLFF